MRKMWLVQVPARPRKQDHYLLRLRTYVAPLGQVLANDLKMNENAIAVLHAALQADIPVMMWGPPGIGKSSMVQTVARKLGLPCEVVVGSVREPSDFAGLPVVRENGGEIPEVPMAPPDWAMRLAKSNEGILFLDEITTAPPAVQAAMLRVVLDRAVGSLTLPRGVRVVAAGNPSDQAADGWELAPPLANRFLHLETHPDVDVFVAGMTLGWDSVTPVVPLYQADEAAIANARALVTGFISTRRDVLHQMPANEAAAGRAWPSPRSWEMVARVLPYLPDDHTARNLSVCGLIGDGAGTEFLAWRENSDLPDPRDVIADPAIMNWNDRPDRIFSVTTSLIAYFAAANPGDRKGKADLWAKTWRAIGYAGEHGPPDILALAAKQLLGLRDKSWAFPPEAKVFLEVLRDAGLTREAFFQKAKKTRV